MANRNYSNTAVSTTLNGSITNSGTSVVLNAQTGMPTPPFLLSIEPDTGNEELVLVNSGAGTSGSPYVVVRGQDGTTGVAHNNGVTVQHRVSAVDFADSRAHEQTGTAVHGLGSSVDVSGATSSITSTITVANTVTETTISKSYSIAGNTLVAGSCWRIVAWGTYGNTATPVINFRVKYGSTVVANDSFAFNAGTSGSWVATGYLNAQTVGASGNLAGSVFVSTQVASGSSTHNTGVESEALVTGISTTSSQNLTMSVQWGTASSSNTISCLGSVIEQVF